MLADQRLGRDDQQQDESRALARAEPREDALVILPDEAGDGRLLLEAYLRWGEACVDRLLGDWVFAIWNARERRLFVARDHHGNTGLYYHTDSRSLTFASSLKGLLALPEAVLVDLVGETVTLDGSGSQASGETGLKIWISGFMPA